MTVGSPERRAVGAVFLLFGADTGTFASRLPWIADRLHLTSGILGVSVGLMMSIGAVVTIPFAARFVHQFGAAGVNQSPDHSDRRSAGAASVRAERVSCSAP